MGTRGALGFVADGIEKISYIQHDSYPGGVGMGVATWISALKSLGGTEGVAWARQAAIDLVAINDQVAITEEQLALLHKRGYARDAKVGWGWYEVLREYQGLPSWLLACGFLAENADFPLDSLFCEWAYMIDLDKEVLEVYQGFTATPRARGRFTERARTPRSNGYYPVRLVKTFTFDELAEGGATLILDLERDGATS